MTTRSIIRRVAADQPKNSDIIHIRAPAGTKGRWVHLAGGEKLGEWIVRMVGRSTKQPDPERYLARFAPKEPGSMTLLTEAQLREVMRAAYIAGANRR